jgi:hypothetical protein
LVVQTTSDRESSVIESVSNVTSKLVDGHARWNERMDVIRRSLSSDLWSRADAEWIMNSKMDAISTDGAIPPTGDQQAAIEGLDGKALEGLIGRLTSRRPSIYVVRH